MFEIASLRFVKNFCAIMASIPCLFLILLNTYAVAAYDINANPMPYGAWPGYCSGQPCWMPRYPYHTTRHYGHDAGVYRPRYPQPMRYESHLPISHRREYGPSPPRGPTSASNGFHPGSFTTAKILTVPQIPNRRSELMTHMHSNLLIPRSVNDASRWTPRVRSEDENESDGVIIQPKLTIPASERDD